MILEPYVREQEMITSNHQIWAGITKNKSQIYESF